MIYILKFLMFMIIILTMTIIGFVIFLLEWNWDKYERMLSDVAFAFEEWW